MVEKIKYILAKKEITTEDIFNSFTLEERLYLAVGPFVNGETLSRLERAAGIETNTSENNYIANFIKRSESENWTLLTSEESLDFLLQLEDEEESLFSALYGLKEYMFSEDLYTFLQKRGFQRDYISVITTELDDDEITLKILEKLDNNEDNENLKENLIKAIKNTELKINLMKKHLKRSQYMYVIEDLEHDEDKAKYMNLVPLGDRLYVITSIKNDDIKERYIHLSSPSRSYIIANLNSDERIEHYLNKYYHLLQYEECRKYINHLDDINLVKEFNYESSLPVEVYGSIDQKVDELLGAE